MKANTSLLRDSATPLYQQLAQRLTEDIGKGLYKPNARLPTESELSALYGVSRITVRQAMDDLVSQGLVARKQGKGTFVLGPLVRHELRELKGFIEGMNKQGIEPETRLLEYGLAAPSPRAAERMGTGSGQLLKMRRLFSWNGVPFAESEVHLPALLASRVAREIADLLPSYLLIEQFLGTEVARADLIIRAAAAGREHARLLQMKSGAPLLAIERLSFNADGVPLEHTYFWSRPENYEFAVSVSGNLTIEQALSRAV